MDKLPDSLKYDIVEEPSSNPPAPSSAEQITEQGDHIPVPDELQDDIPLEKDVDDDLPVFKPKPEPKLEDIFSMSDKPKKKLTKSGRPRKPMTEEHKQKLALAREKANAKRKYLADQRKKAKAMEKETKELMKKKKEKEYHKLKKEVEEPVDEETEESNPNFVYEKKESVHKPQVQYLGLTKEDLDKSHLNAILKVEAMRKERKAEKKKKQQIDAYNQETLKTLKKMTWQDTAGLYSNCF
jgi:hypothetical protein